MSGEKQPFPLNIFARFIGSRKIDATIRRTFSPENRDPETGRNLSYQAFMEQYMPTIFAKRFDTKFDIAQTLGLEGNTLAAFNLLLAAKVLDASGEEKPESFREELAAANKFKAQAALLLLETPDNAEKVTRAADTLGKDYATIAMGEVGAAHAFGYPLVEVTQQTTREQAIKGIFDDSANRRLEKIKITVQAHLKSL